MTWAHHDMLSIALLCKLLLWKSVGDHIFTWWHHNTNVTRCSCGKFTSRRTFMLELYLHLLVRREFIVYVLRWNHHCLNHLLLLMRGSGSIVGRVDGSWIWRRWLLPSSLRVWIKQVIEQSDAWLIFNQIVIKLLLHELGEHLKLVGAGLIDIAVPDFRNDLYFPINVLFFTLKALKKSLNVNIVETISDTPPRWCADIPPDLVDEEPLPLCQYSGALSIIFFK